MHRSVRILTMLDLVSIAVRYDVVAIGGCSVPEINSHFWSSATRHLRVLAKSNWQSRPNQELSFSTAE